MSKFSQFYWKKVQNSHFSEFKYSLPNLLKWSQQLKLWYIWPEHRFYSIYTNIQWNNCHFPTDVLAGQCLKFCDDTPSAAMLPNLFQQDRAPAHRSRHTVAYLRSNVPEFFEPENWPPNSPDLNPVDYAVWGHCSRWCIVAKFYTLTSWNVCLSTVGLS